jgi:hypothetical protein
MHAPILPRCPKEHHMLRFIAMMPRAVGIRGSRSNTGDGLAPAASESGLAARAARSFGTSSGVSEKLFSSPFRQTVSLAVAPGVRPRPRLRRSGQNNLRANRVCSGFNAKVDDWASSELPGARLKTRIEKRAVCHGSRIHQQSDSWAFIHS